MGMDELVPLEELKRRAIFRALRETGGDKLAAARLLGIGKTTLYRKLKEYAFDSSESAKSSESDSGHAGVKRYVNKLILNSGLISGARKTIRRSRSLHAA